MNVAGTKVDTQSFRLLFLRFDWEDQRWQAECMFGDEKVVLGSAEGMAKWVIRGAVEIEVPTELCNHLSAITHHALADYQILKAYKLAVGEYPAEIIQ